MQKYQSIISGTNGSVIRNVPVTVLKEDGSLAEIFMDREGQVQAPNPLVTDSRGVFYFYAKNGRYSLRTAADGVQITDADTVLLFDPDETATDGPIADAVRRAEDAAERAETALSDSGLQNLVQDAQDAAANAVQAVIGANQAVASIDAALIEAGEAKDAAQAAAQTASTAASDAQAVKDSLLNYDGTLSAAPSFDDVPAHTDPAFDAQAQALANRTEIIKSAVLSFPDYAAASAAAATLPDGQRVEVVMDETHTGRSTIYTVQGGSLVFARMASDVASVTDFGAKLDGSDDTAAVNAASNAVKAAGGGVLKWPAGNYSFVFTKPPYGVIWDMDGPDITRAQLGGSGNAVRFQRARLAYIDGPHPTSQVQTEHVRTIAKGSGAIGAPYADYTMGLTIEKENWNKPAEVQAGEIDTLTIFLRAGGPALPAADGGISGGAGILGNVGMLDGSGMVQFIEATSSVFDRNNPNVINRQINTQLLGLNPRDGTYYGSVYNNILGSQNAAIRVSGTTDNPWNRILENQKGNVVNFHITDEGQIRWRKTATVSLEQEAVTNDLLFKTEAGVEVARVDVSQALLQAKTRTNVKNGASVTLTTDDLGCVVSLFHTAGMTLTLPNSLPAGFHCRVLQRDAPSQVTFSPESGAILRNVNGHTKTKAAHAICNLFVASNTSGTNAIWYLSGDTSA